MNEFCTLCKLRLVAARHHRRSKDGADCIRVHDEGYCGDFGCEISNAISGDKPKPFTIETDG